MKKTALVTTMVLGATLLGTGITVNAEPVAGINPVPPLPLQVKPSVATFSFSETTTKSLEAIDFEAIDFESPSLTGNVTVGATLGNKDFGTKKVSIAVTTSGNGLSIVTSDFVLEAGQATEVSDEATYEYKLNATEFDSKAPETYNVTIKATETTESNEKPRN